MKVQFTFNLPMEHSVNNDPCRMLDIEAEVVGVGSPHETAFINKVSGRGVDVLWGIKPSPNLFALVCKLACETAARELHNSIQVDEQVRYSAETAVMIAEEVLV